MCALCVCASHFCSVFVKIFCCSVIRTDTQIQKTDGKKVGSISKVQFKINEKEKNQQICKINQAVVWS